MTADMHHPRRTPLHVVGLRHSLCDRHTASDSAGVGVRARVNGYASFEAFALGPIGLAAAGPISALVGTPGVLGFVAVWSP
ncbi:hypothetical protein GCM10010390_49860 [Streptomyces mordarskii]|uniref:Uncharacterized protein n=1 Tax=Streptomyces mordarskii TaxID=1226758 RepID=A0ABN1DEZ8_9ACTN